jgi:hypothetical protein
MNDIKKSIEVLKEQIIKNEKILDGLPEKARAGATDLSNVVKACHVAISALEKQIPKKPKQYNDKSIFIYEGVFYCPSCQENVSMDDVYCCQCGQSLDWEEENE